MCNLVAKLAMRQSNQLGARSTQLEQWQQAHYTVRITLYAVHKASYTTVLQHPTHWRPERAESDLVYIEHGNFSVCVQTAGSL